MTAELTLDIAKTNYARGERTQAVSFLRRSTRTQPTIDGLLLARWLQETRLEGRTNIQKVFADILDLLVDVGDNEKRGKYESRLAPVCAAEHDSFVELHNSHPVQAHRDIDETCMTEFGSSTRARCRRQTSIRPTSNAAWRRSSTTASRSRTRRGTRARRLSITRRHFCSHRATSSTPSSVP